MVMLNPNAADPYHLVALTAAINEMPYIPQLLEQWLPWNTVGEASDKLLIEFLENGGLSLIEEAERGTLGDPTQRDDRSEVQIRVPYYPQFETLKAAQVGGVRAFASENGFEGYSQKLNDLLVKMKKKNSLMREFIRAGALAGIIRKASGGVSQNLFQAFGITQNTKAIDLTDPTTDVIAEIIEAKEMAEDELGEYQGMASGYKLIAGKEWHRQASRHASVQKAFALWSATGNTGNLGSALRDDVRAGFPITSDVDLVSYSKGKIGATQFIDPEKAYLCPIVDGLYQTRYAPGTHKDAINTIGLPEYAQIQELPFGKGDQVHTEMSVVSFVERPRAVIELTIG